MYCVFVLNNVLPIFIAVGALCVIMPDLAIYPTDLKRSTGIWGVKKTFAYIRHAGVIMAAVFTILFLIYG